MARGCLARRKPPFNRLQTLEAAHYESLGVRTGRVPPVSVVMPEPSHTPLPPLLQWLVSSG